MAQEILYDKLKLNNQICFPMYAASREIIKQYKPYLDEMDLTYTQYIAMLVLWEKKTLTVKEMGEQLYLDSGTLTPLLKKLEAKGFINRVRSIEDERNLNVIITEKGEKLKVKAEEIPKRILEGTKIDLAELEAFYKTLQKILKKGKE